MAEKAVSEKSGLGEQVLGEAQTKALAKEEYWATAISLFYFKAAVAHDVGQMAWKRWEASQGFYELLMMPRWLVSEKSMAEKISQRDRRTLVHSSQSEKVEADIEGLKGWRVKIETAEGINGREEWPSYASKDFETIVLRTRELEEAGRGSSRVLYCMMELETLLDAVAKKARATGRKYAGRLAASLRDICRIYEPDEISEQQAKRFSMCVRALIEGWRDLNREKVSWIRSKLLDVGLTWLPVTRKAQKEIEEAKKSNTIANG